MSVGQDSRFSRPGAKPRHPSPTVGDHVSFQLVSPQPLPIMHTQPSRLTSQALLLFRFRRRTLLNRRSLIVLAIACAVLVSLFGSGTLDPPRLRPLRLAVWREQPHNEDTSERFFCPANHSRLYVDPNSEAVSHDDKLGRKQNPPNSNADPNVDLGTTTPTAPKAVLQNGPLRNALFPIPDPDRTDGNVWIDENHRQLKALFRCIELDTCGPNQAKGSLPFFFGFISNIDHRWFALAVVILHSHHFTGALWGWTGGEDMWYAKFIYFR